MMNPMSPEWKKPSDIMKIHRKKVPARGYIANRAPSMTVSVPGGSPAGNRSSPRKKRKNPFGCSPRKGSPRKRANLNLSSEMIQFRRESPRKKTRLNFDKAESSGVLLDVLNTKERFSFAKSPKKMAQASPYPVLPEPPTSQRTESQSSTEKDEEEEADYSQPWFPRDWSLKMKARFTSTESFAWCGSLKSVDEARGMARFIEKSSPVVDLQGKPPAQCPLAKAELHKCCLYWVHPNIPWLKLFPRMVTDSKIGKTSVVLQDKQVLESIMNDWITSFTSAFQLVRAGSCPYLYMCCHQFTVAFFSANTRSAGLMEAVVTPTSRGFREALKTEGIEFTLPLQPKSQTESSPKSSSKEAPKTPEAEEETAKETADPSADPPSSQTSTTTKDDDEDDDDIDPTDEGAASWLETLGLDKRRYRSLDPSKVKLQREGYRLIDNRPESTLHVHGPQVQALFNYLLNCRSCVANTGVQGGIPPTLIAPTSFNGATLKTLKMKHGNLRRQHANQPPQYSLEVTGPILPAAYTGLSTLFTATQRAYTATYSVHEPTAPFNVHLPKPENDDVDDDEVSAETLTLGKEAIRELVCNDDRYTWVHY